MRSLEGNVAVVTGGGRGLGRSIALALAAQGAAVAIDDVFRSEGGTRAADEVARQVTANGGRALALTEDVSTSAGAEAMVGETVDAFGRLDVLVCCAGNTVRGLLHELSEEQWDSLLDLHVKGHFLSCKTALPHMLERDYGRILTVSSRGAFFQVPAKKADAKDDRRPPSTAYSAAKAGILGLTVTLAVELWDTGVNANCLLPSATTQLFPETSPRKVGGTPASQSLDPDDVAPAAVYLCSSEAEQISGKIVYASGGDVVVFGEQLSMAGSRMIRKQGRWTQEELAGVVPPLLGIA